MAARQGMEACPGGTERMAKMTQYNDPDNCLDRLFLLNIIPAPVQPQYTVRWLDIAPALGALLARIEALENEVSALKKGP